MIGVLIVEDNELFRRLIAENLKLEFSRLDIYEAATGEEALQQVETYQPELIFMDLLLGEESGFDIIRRIKSIQPGVTIAVLTSFDLPEYKEMARNCGVDHFLIKGTSTREDILAVVNLILTKSGGGGAQLPV